MQAAAPMTPMLRSAVAVAAALALAACQGEPSTAPKTPYPYDIVFERREGTAGPPDLYLLDFENETATRFLAGSLGGMHPAGSPAGSQIAFVRTDAEFNSEVFIVSRGGTGLTNVSNHGEVDEMPAWSPDGQRIAFVTDRDGFQDIFVINTNGTNLRRITPVDPLPAVTTEWWPAWSRDGTRLAYSTTIDGTADIWTTTVDATPTTRRRLTATVDSDVRPAWSPDGLRIAFQRIDANTGEANIVILTLDSGALEVIDLPGQQLWPAWSPEGDLIAFASNHDDADFEIYTIEVDGGDVVRRTENGVNDLRPTWLIRPITID